MALITTSNPATSVVDYLTSKGIQPQTGEKYPLFSTRAKLFQSAGLGNEADFRGSTDQNTALLNTLLKAEKSGGVSITPDNIYKIISASQAPSQQAPATPAISQQDYQLKQGETIDQYTARIASLRGETKPTPTPAPTPTPTPTPTQPTPEATQAALPTTPDASTLAQQALEQVTSSATFPLQQAQAQQQKDKIELTKQQDTQKFINDIASKGLFFSGKTGVGVSAIDAKALADKLGVDTNTGLLIATGLENAAQKIATQAQAGRKEAIDALQALGFAINPLTGKVEPTLAARSAVSTAENRDTTQALNQAKFELQQAQAEFNNAKSSTQLDMAQQRIDIALQRLQLAQEKGGGAGFTDTQLNSGASAAGKTIQEFRALPPDTQNEYISGDLKDLVGGRATPEKMKEHKKKLLDELASIKTNPGDLIKEIDDGKLPQPDKEELKQYVRDNSEGLWNFLKRLAP